MTEPAPDATKLLADDLGSLDPAAVRAECADIAKRLAYSCAQQDAARHAELVDLRRFDQLKGWHLDGAKTCAHWVSWRLKKSLGAARERLRVGHALAKLPQIDGAFKKGRLSYCQVRAMTRVATPENEAQLLEYALHSTGNQLEVLCRKVRTAKELSQLENDPEIAELLRSFRYRRVGWGMVRFEGQVREEDWAIIGQALESAGVLLGRPSPSPPAPSPPTRPEERTAKVPAPLETTSAECADLEPLADSAPEPVPEEMLAARRADALVAVARSFLDRETIDPKTTATIHELLVHVDAELLAKAATLTPDMVLAGARSETGRGHGLSPETIRRLACDGAIVPVHHDKEGRVIGLGPRSRTIPQATRRALVSRDNGCRFPGCRSTFSLQAHHVVFWADGGETTVDNLVLLCSYHHRLVHEGGFVARLRGDAFEVSDRTGRVLEHVPGSIDVGESAVRDLVRDNCRRGSRVGDWSNLPLWDGSRLDYGAAVASIQASEDPPRALTKEELDDGIPPPDPYDTPPPRHRTPASPIFITIA